jgi:hypothetical protein
MINICAMILKNTIPPYKWVIQGTKNMGQMMQSTTNELIMTKDYLLQIRKAN